jgi:hypothetical protein
MPFALAEFDLAEFLHGEATPATAAWGRRLGTVTASSELVAENIPSSYLPPSNVRAKQSGFPIIDSCYRSLAPSCMAEEFINLAHGRPFGTSGRHLSSGYAWLSIT